jgi:uncharacterized lipoprotein YbaY
MKNPFLLAGCAAMAAVLCAGCGHLSLASEGDPDRVLTGSVQFSDAVVLPPGTEVVVRVIDQTPPNPNAVNMMAGSTMPMTTQPNVAATAPGPEVLGEQTITNPTSVPVPYSVEYHAEDDALRRGLAIEVRVSIGGTVRYFNATQYAVTLSDVSDPHDISVEPAR